MMAYLLYGIVTLAVISYNSVSTQLIINPVMSETCALMCESEVQQIYHIITHMKDNISTLEVKQSKIDETAEVKGERMQSQIDTMKIKEEDMQRKIEAMERKEEGMQRKIDAMEVQEEGMHSLIAAMAVREEGMQSIIDAMQLKEKGMQSLIDAIEMKEEEMQSQINALETNEILMKLEREVRNLTEQNENLIEQQTNCSIIAEHQQTEMDELREKNSAFKGNIYVFSL